MPSRSALPRPKATMEPGHPVWEFRRAHAAWMSARRAEAWQRAIAPALRTEQVAAWSDRMADEREDALQVLRSHFRRQAFGFAKLIAQESGWLDWESVPAGKKRKYMEIGRLAAAAFDNGTSYFGAIAKMKGRGT